MPITIVDHPLAQHYLTCLRDETTGPAAFRSLARKLTALLAVEATRDLRTTAKPIRTPLKAIHSPALAEELVIVPILRAGLGMVDAIVDLFPEVSVGYIGMERDEATAVAKNYYLKLPDIAGRNVLLVDPMLATGGSASRALRDLYARNPAQVRLVCVVAAPEGVAAVEDEFPGIEIFSAALDEGLNEKKYIVPGLGDFGDRLYGTF
jgi:uracil phosphoribosyltransferase